MRSASETAKRRAKYLAPSLPPPVLLDWYVGVHLFLTTRPLKIASNIRITVRRSAWDYLSKSLDAEKNMLVFVWGMHGPRSDPGWTASVIDRDDLPNSANTRIVKTRIGEFPVAIPQRQHMRKLDGCTLAYDANQLKVNVPFDSWLDNLRSTDHD